jgi:hypothetical protein
MRHRECINIQCQILESHQVHKIGDSVEIYLMCSEGKVDSVAHATGGHEKCQQMYYYSVHHKKSTFCPSYIVGAV